jgi:hypothetical protein
MNTFRSVDSKDVYRELQFCQFDVLSYRCAETRMTLMFLLLVSKAGGKRKCGNLVAARNSLQGHATTSAVGLSREKVIG